jgi:pimeloyl-ACP methyl ester carboxylesterase
MRAHDFRIDVTAAADVGEPASLAASLYLPDAPLGPKAHLLYCLHGGGYRRGYWNPPYADESYSFARHFTDRGKAVLAVDQLGMGDSTRPQPESRMNYAKSAAASARALAEGVRMLTDGTHAQVRSLSVTGVGHSMGGMLITGQAADHGGFDRVAILGWTNGQLNINGASMPQRATFEGYLDAPGAAMRPLFHAADVPLAIVEADEAAATETPASMIVVARSPGAVSAAAARITVPVLLVFSAVDTSPDPHAEPAFYAASPDVTLNLLPDAAHCQNFASTRRRHWERLDRWIDSLAG